MSNPCHIEVIVSEMEEAVQKAEDKQVLHLNSRQRGRVLGQQQRAITAA